MPGDKKHSEKKLKVVKYSLVNGDYGGVGFLNKKKNVVYDEATVD